jgi:hypothetical protein
MYKNSFSTSQKTHGLHYIDQLVSTVADTEKSIKLKNTVCEKNNKLEILFFIPLLPVVFSCIVNKQKYAVQHNTLM